MKATHQTPSNIALIKYWGKHGQQLPNNPSISFSLNNSYTTTSIETSPKKEDQPIITFLFEGKEQISFLPKIQHMLQQAIALYPSLANYDYHIESVNSFPHSAGIASSASSMAALAYGWCEIAWVAIHTQAWKKEVSHLARLGSGSACRSIYPRASRGFTSQWGSDLHATLLTDIHPDFQDIQDTIILIDDTPKTISSTQWHACMESNPYAHQRYQNAHIRHHKLLNILQDGWRQEFTHIVESEALDLHAMMMTSSDYFSLLQPGTIAIMHALRKLRKDTNIPFTFSIDAGPNIHLLYPPSSQKTIQQFLHNNKKHYISYIDDHVTSP